MLRIGWTVYLCFGSLTLDSRYWFSLLFIVCVIILLVFWILHKELNPIDIYKEIEEIWKKNQKQET